MNLTLFAKADKHFDEKLPVIGVEEKTGQLSALRHRLRECSDSM